MEGILIVDFGSQYTRLLAKKVREFEVYSEVIMPDEFSRYINNGSALDNKINIDKKNGINKKDIFSIKKNLDVIRGIILSGGPGSVSEEHYPDIENFIKNNFNKNGVVPVLGVCYGMQLIAKVSGGKVEKTEIAEYGSTSIVIKDSNQIENKDKNDKKIDKNNKKMNKDNKRIDKDNKKIYKNNKNVDKKNKVSKSYDINRLNLFYDIEKRFKVWMSHGDSVVKLPEDLKIRAYSDNNVIAAFEDTKRKIYAIQFHPEVHHTENGDKIISNFIFNICEAKKNWSIGTIVENEIEKIKNVVKDKKAIIGLSGGVDSSVASVIAHKAIGNNLKAVFVDHGLLRKNEVNEVKNIFKNLLNMNLLVVDAKKEFLSELKRVVDPEKKRKIIGEKFIRVFEREAFKENDIDFLIQGTIYSDVIESAASGKKTAKIKSHHNVGGLPEKLNLKIVEPLRYLFKDEVRKVGRYLGIPDKILERHPFPGPGLAIRIIGEITEEKVKILQEADYIFIKNLKESGWYNKVWQAFVVLTSIRSVGVVGDNRKYGYVAALRAVNSKEGMTANWSYLPHNLIEKISNEITNKVPEIGRVVYDVSSKPPSTIEWE